MASGSDRAFFSVVGVPRERRVGLIVPESPSFRDRYVGFAMYSSIRDGSGKPRSFFWRKKSVSVGVFRRNFQRAIRRVISGRASSPWCYRPKRYCTKRYCHESIELGFPFLLHEDGFFSRPPGRPTHGSDPRGGDLASRLGFARTPHLPVRVRDPAEQRPTPRLEGGGVGGGGLVGDDGVELGDEDLSADGPLKVPPSELSDVRT